MNIQVMKSKGRKKIIGAKGLVLLTLTIILFAACSSSTTEKDATRGKGLATLIVQFDSTKIITKCIEIDSAGINGIEFLKLSGLALTLGFNGGFVCKIEDTGCEGAPNCQCPKEGEEFVSWVNWHFINGKYEASQVGGLDYTVKPGFIDAWRFSVRQVAPSVKDPTQICNQ